MKIAIIGAETGLGSNAASHLIQYTKNEVFCMVSKTWDRNIPQLAPALSAKSRSSMQFWSERDSESASIRLAYENPDLILKFSNTDLFDDTRVKIIDFSKNDFADVGPKDIIVFGPRMNDGALSHMMDCALDQKTCEFENKEVGVAYTKDFLNLLDKKILGENCTLKTEAIDLKKLNDIVKNVVNGREPYFVNTGVMVYDLVAAIEHTLVWRKRNPWIRKIV